MAYATYQDVERYAGITFTPEEQAQVDAFCEDATAWMRDFCGEHDLEGVVSDVNTLRMICARLVAGLWALRQRNRDYPGASSVRIGDFSVSFERVVEADAALQLKLDTLQLRAETASGVEVVEFDYRSI